MSDTNEPKLTELFKLTPEGKRQMQEANRLLKIAEKGLDDLEAMGLDTTQLRQEIQTYKSRRDIIERDFTD